MTHRSYPAPAVEERQSSTCGRSPLNVTVVSSVEGFRSLRREWDGLLRASRSDCVFLTWEWLFTWWKWYGGSAQLLILLLSDSTGRLRGIAPLMSKRTAGVFRKLQIIGSESRVCSEYLDIIAEEGCEKDVARAILDFLLDNHRSWDTFSLSSIRRGSPFLLAFEQLPEIRRLRSRRTTQYVAPYISLPETWDELLARFGPRIRRNVRYYRKRLEKAFSVEFSSREVGLDTRHAINTMRRLQQKSISRKGIRGIFEDETFSNFHAEIMDLFHRNGWLYIVFVVCDGNPVAFWYAYLYAGTCYSYQTGFDLDYGSHSVGSVVHSFVLEDTIGKGIHTFDYLRGGQEYKYHFANSAREMLEVSIFNNSWSGLLVRFVLAFGEHLRFCISRFMGNNLKDKLRALMQRG